MAKRRRVPFSKDVLSAALSLLGQRGGRVRAERLTPERRSEIARMGALAKSVKAKARRASKTRAKTP